MTAEARRCGVRYIILVVISVETIELTERSVTSVSIHERFRARYHIITVARARGTLLYSPGNEIRIVATAAILGRIGESEERAAREPSKLTARIKNSNGRSSRSAVG